MNNNRLSNEEISGLIAYHKELRVKRDADKLKCIIYWGKGYSWEEIKELLFISDGTLKTYIDKYQKGGIKELLQLHYEGHNNKLTNEQEQTIIDYVDKYSVLNSKQVVRYIKHKFGIKFTINGMTKTLIRLGFSYKKPKRISCNKDNVEEKIFVYRYKIKSENLSEDEALYSLDGAGIEHNAKIDYGWMRKGTTKTIQTNSGRKRLNINGAYNIKTHEVIAICQEENITTKSNIELIKKIITKNQDKRKITIILDNAKMNKNNEIFNFVKEQNKTGTKIELMYTPPYCPHLNLIERLWRFTKKKLVANQYYSTYSKFRNSITDFFATKIYKLKNELKSLMTENFEGYSMSNNTSILKYC
jgi:transposase